MPDESHNMTQIWAHSPQRYLAFLNERVAGIDFGVQRDLAGMPKDEVSTALKGLGMTNAVIAEFNRLIHEVPLGSYVVTSIPKAFGWADRKWSIGRVTGGYRYRPDIVHDRHTIQVDWFAERYSDDEIVEEIGVNPSGRRSAVNALGIVYHPRSKNGPL